MHADRPGDRPRLLYWYRTAPGIALGRPPLDEDAIRTIEEQHPDIDFDWPAILALAEVMTPEDEAPAPRPQQPRRERKKGRESAGPRQPSSDRRRDDRAEEPAAASAAPEAEADVTAEREPDASPIEMPAPRNLLVEELAGREIGARLRARHAEIVARIEDADIDGGVKDALFKRAEAIDPELWMTPEQVLEGVRKADALYEQFRQELATP